ncbi:MAG TPA: hypothetical protein VFA59_04245 [Vicinamibacterales bacterium]|nr:hypothetical protein [Vicinamibacterales bacterium]
MANDAQRYRPLYGFLVAIATVTLAVNVYVTTTRHSAVRPTSWLSPISILLLGAAGLLAPKRPLARMVLVGFAFACAAFDIAAMIRG